MKPLQRMAHGGLCLAMLWTLGSGSPARAEDERGNPAESFRHRPEHLWKLPEITNQPDSVTVTPGQPVTFTVQATGKGPLFYLWRKNGRVLGWFGPTLRIFRAHLRDQGRYTVTVTNPKGSVTSLPAELTLNLPPAIIAQPAGLTVAQGAAARLAVTATGSGTLGYQWRKGGVDLAGANAASYAIASAGAADAGAYDVVVSNTLNGTVTRTTSRPAGVLVNLTPGISGQPVSQTIAQGGTASFSVTASGSGVLSYQWRKGGMAIPGAVAASCRITPVTPADAGSYDVVVANALNGTVTTVVSGAAVLTVNAPPVIATQPTPLTLVQGEAGAFSVTASGSGSLGYQWRKDGQALSGATAAALEFSSVRAADAGSYDVVVSNTLDGSVTTAVSAAALLTVRVPPTIQVQPKSQTVMPPDPVTFKVEATGNNGLPLTYAWKKNGVLLPDASSASYTVASTEFPTNSDVYVAVVADGDLKVESEPVTAVASIPSQVYAGDPVPVPSRPITVLNSLHTDPVNFPGGAFRLGYDETLKDPVWGVSINFPVHQPYANSDADYTADLRLAAPQVGKNDYNGIYTGGAGSANSYDRGHMVPRADVSYRYTPTAGADATIMSNLVPQISQFNQQTWQKLETAFGGTGGGDTDGLTSFKGRVWVYTGSVFPANPTFWHSTVTPGLNVAIPTACYKIAVTERAPGHPEVLAMLMPNTWGLANSTSTLTSYVTSVARIEALTGLNLFPNLATVAPDLDVAAWKATVDVRGWRAPFEWASGPNVHMIQPSWDTAIALNDTVAFEGAATPAASAAADTTVASATWNFGDGSPTATGFSTSHQYTAGGAFNATFTVTDSLGSSNTLTRVIRVSGGNTAPEFAGLVDKSSTTGNAVTATFTVSDDRTPAAGLLVTATCSNPALLPDPLVVDNLNGACSLLLTPGAGATGSAVVTVTVTDGDNVSTEKTFTFTVRAPGDGSQPSLIISQYYEGTSYNKWLEVTNVGGSAYDAAVAPLYLGIWTNPNTSNTFKTVLVPGTLAPGASILFRNSGAVLPLAGNLTNGASAITDNGVVAFNGNDAVFLSTVATATSASWAARVDCLGDLSWGAANPAADKSFYRIPTVLTGNPTFVAAEWVQKTMAEVEGAQPTDTFRLGYHAFTPAP